MKFIYGYVTSRSFSGLSIPVPAQNCALREYCNRNNATYILPPLESYFDNCYHQLFGLINNVQLNSNVLMYSLLMLPIFSNSDKLKKIEEISISKNINYHFVLENFSSKIDQKNFKNEVFNYKLNNYKATPDRLIIYIK